MKGCVRPPRPSEMSPRRRKIAHHGIAEIRWSGFGRRAVGSRRLWYQREFKSPALLLRTRFRRHHSSDAVIHHQLSVVFSRMLKHFPCQVRYSDLLLCEGVDNQIAHTLVTLEFDCCCAVGKRLFHKLNHCGLSVKLAAFGIFFRREFQPHYGIRKKIIHIRSVQQLLGKTPLRWHRLEIVFVLGKILRHRNQLPSNIIPVLEQHLRRPHRRLRRSFVLYRVLRGGGRSEDSESNHQAHDLLFHFVHPSPDFLLQSSLLQHFQELLLRPHIDRLCYQLSLPIVDKALRNAIHHKRVLYLPAWSQQHRKRNLALADKRLNRRRLFIGNTEDYEPLRFKTLVKRLQIRHLLAAGRTPCRPEIHQHNLSAQI